MKKIREMIRMHQEYHISHRKISKALGVSRPTIHEYIGKFEQSGLTLSEISTMSDSGLMEALERKNTVKNGPCEALNKLFPVYSKELMKTGVNLKTLWEEYRKKYADGYGYSQFCYHYGNWNHSLEISMHQEYKAGDKMFVDFTGKKMSLTDRITGEKREVETFVGILGASQYTYVEAVGNQKKENFIRANENALRYFGGVPAAIVPDCLKSGVTKGDKYEPDINPEYEDFARHYDTCILPARPYHPKDKAHVENAVKIVYSWIFAVLRNQVFYTIEELNQAILEALENYNSKKMQKLKQSRKEVFLEIEKKELRPLPIEKYSFKNFAQATIQFNYHIYLKEDNHYYSVPYHYRGKKADLIYTDRAVEIFFENTRIAVHPRDRRKQCYTTDKNHMPPEHRWVSDWNPERIIKWGASQGHNVEEMVRNILKSREHPEQAYRACLGVLSLEKKVGKERLDKACGRALSFQHYSYKGVKRILEKGLDHYEDEPALFPKTIAHENIRGNEYYYEEK